MDNRNETREFLASRRARITPEQAGLPIYGGKRRVAGLRREAAPARASIDELMPDVLNGKIEPGRDFDRTVDLDGVPVGYKAIADREALKVLGRP